MQDIVVLFKTVDTRQLSDPGRQLAKVLKFKKDLERSKTILFETFDSIDSFSEKIRRHLASWTRRHEGATLQPNNSRTKKRPQATVHSSFGFENDETIDEPYIKKIENDYNKGNLTEIEARLVRKVVSHKSLSAFYEYGLFLTKSDRLTDALEIFDEMHRLASADNNTLSWAGSAMARIGGIYRMQSKYKDSENALLESISLKRQAKDGKGEMSACIWLGDLLTQRNRPQNASEAFKNALTLSEDFGNETIKADTSFKLAKCLMNGNQIAESLKWADQALLIYKSLNLKICMRSIKQWKKSKKGKTEEC